MTITPELTFIPARAPHRLTKRAACTLAGRINRRLEKVGYPSLVAKADFFPPENDTDKDHYIIEIVPFVGALWESEDLFSQGEEHKLAELFGALKRDFGLVPTLVRRRGGEEIHHPNGGCHFHVGCDLFPFSERFYFHLERFHRNIALDYANRPYVSWLFRAWFDNLNSGISYIKELASSSTGSDVMWWAKHTSAIIPRFAPYNKGAYPTFEFRFFSMGATAREVFLMGRFVTAWVDKMREPATNLSYSLKSEHFAGFRNLRQMDERFNIWFHTLGLDWAQYRVFFERNYVNRIKFGKLT